MADSREDSVYLAKLAEQAERYEEMVENMKRVASSDQELTVEERNLLSVAYKNVIGARRASWRIVSSIEQKEESKGNDAQQVTMIKGYREKIEAELAKICEDILDVLDKHLIPSAASGESKVFYHKMMGDYHRYLAEFATGDKRKASADKSLEAYKAASDVAVTELPPTHPIRLGLALNRCSLPTSRPPNACASRCAKVTAFIALSVNLSKTDATTTTLPPDDDDNDNDDGNDRRFTLSPSLDRAPTPPLMHPAELHLLFAATVCGVQSFCFRWQHNAKGECRDIDIVASSITTILPSLTFELLLTYRLYYTLRTSGVRVGVMKLTTLQEFLPELWQFVAQMPKATLEEEAATGAAVAVASCLSHGLYFPTRHLLFSKTRKIPTSDHLFQLTARFLDSFIGCLHSKL